MHEALRELLRSQDARVHESFFFRVQQEHWTTLLNIPLLRLSHQPQETQGRTPHGMYMYAKHTVWK